MPIRILAKSLPKKRRKLSLRWVAKGLPAAILASKDDLAINRADRT